MRWHRIGDVQDVAGHRVLRTVGFGDRARLLLGFGDEATVVLKITATDDPRTAAELTALERGADDHVVRLLDVAADADETVLVLERLPRGTLAELLERRAGIEAGEAVTVLAPLAATLDRLHGLGVAHGALSLGAVAFREDGAPVLLGFGAAELFAAGTPEVVRETVEGVRADRAALREIVGVVLGRVRGSRAEAVRRLAAGIEDAPPLGIADALFGLAAPAAVRFEDDPEPVSAARLGGVADVVADTHEVDRPVVPPWLVALIPDSVREPVVDTATRVARLWGGWSSGRRRLALGAAAGLVTVVLAVALVPSGSSTVAAEEPIPSPTLTMESARPSLPEDPVEAVVLLLDERERCLRDLSLLCLETVVQLGSAAQDDDHELVRAVQGGAEYPGAGVLAGDPVLVERLGDSALIDLPEGSVPASVLLLRTAEGWRIRDYLAGAPALSG